MQQPLVDLPVLLRAPDKVDLDVLTRAALKPVARHRQQVRALNRRIRDHRNEMSLISLLGIC